MNIGLNTTQLEFEDGVPYVVFNGWLHDRNNNRWSIAKYGSVDKAVQAAESCDWGAFSSNNTNCSKIERSENIQSCEGLFIIEDCKDLDELTFCVGMKNCEGLYSLYGLDGVEGIEQHEVLSVRYGDFWLTIDQKKADWRGEAKTNQEWLKKQRRRVQSQ